MNIGSLTATLGFDTTAAMRSMTSFERMMLTVVNKIDDQLEKMSSAFMQVGGSAIAMGNSSATGMNKIIVASKMAKVEMAQLTTQIIATDAAVKMVSKNVGTGNIAGHISGIVAKNQQVNAMATANKVPNKVINEAIGEAIAESKATQIKIANRIKEANAWADSASKKIQADKKVQVQAIGDDQKRTALILSNRIKEANAYADSAWKKIQSDKRAQIQALLENRRRDIQLNTKPAIDSLDNLQNKLAGLNSALQRFGYLAMTAFTLPIVLGGKAVFNLVKDYEFSIQKIVGLTGIAQTAVNNWSKDLLAMGPQLGQMPKELADALYFISSSGIKGAEAMNVLNLSAKAATAGLGDVKTVADLLTSALNAYAGTGLTAAKAANTLVAAVREGKAEASGFATAMGQIIPIAAQLGVSFDQVAGGMAAITLTGASSTNAAVYLKGVFNSLLTASTKGEKALNAVGTSYAELRKILGSQGLIPLMQKLRDIQMKYGDELISDVLPNIRSLTGFLSLAGKNFKYNTELMNRVVNSAGSLGKAFAAVADTIKVRYDRAISQAQVSMISFGKSLADAVLPFLEKLVKKLGELTNWFNNLSESGKRLVLQIAGVAAVLGPLSLLVSAFVWILRGLVSAAGTVTEVFTALRVVMMANPWILVVAAAAGLITALIHARGRTKDFADSQSVLKGVLIDVNGEFKKMQELTKADYSSMSVTGLSAAYATAWNTALEAKKRYDGYVAARKGESKLNAWLKSGKYDILEESALKDWETAKGVLVGISEAFGLIAKSTEVAANSTEVLLSKLQKIKGFADDKWADALKKGFDFERMSEKAFKIMGADTKGSLYTGGGVQGAGDNRSDLVKEMMKQSGINATLTQSMPAFASQQSAIEKYNNSLVSQNTIINELAGTFEDMFKEVGGGFKGMIDAFINSIKLLLAQLAGKTVLLLLANLIAPGSSFAVGVWKNLFKFTGGIGMAKGGVVPGGFSNDTYPAMLSSGETVLPKGLSNLRMQPLVIEDDVRFVIEENQLVGILKKSNIRKSLY